MMSGGRDPVVLNGIDEDRRMKETYCRWDEDEMFLPFTAREAVLLLSPVSQVYSPLSFTSNLCMTSVWVEAFCSILYFSPWVSTVESFSQVTLQSERDVSQDRVALSPSVLSTLCSSFVNSTGGAARQIMIN